VLPIFFSGVQSGVAHRYAPFAFLRGSSPAHEVPCFVFPAVVDVSMLRTAEEAKLRLPLRYLTSGHSKRKSSFTTVFKRYITVLFDPPCGNVMFPAKSGLDVPDFSRLH